MGVSFKKGSFVTPASTGTQDITDVGFQPKAVILFSSPTATPLNTFVDEPFLSYGFSDGTTSCCTTFECADASASSNTWSSIYNNAAVQFLGYAGGYEYFTAKVDSFLSNGFRMNYTTNATGAGFPIDYIAIGGTDITNVKVGTQSIGTTTTGNKAYTGVGFQGDFMLAASNNILTPSGAYTYTATGSANAGFVLGCAKSSTNRWTISTASEHSRANADTWRYQRGDKCMAFLDNTTGGRLAEADFVSFDTDGFTWNYTTNSTANNQHIPFIYMVIKGGVWDVGNFQSPATNTTVTTNTAASSTLKGIQTIDVGSNLITSTTISSNNNISLGGSDGTTQGCIAISDLDAAGNMVNACFRTTSYTIYQILAAATASSSTIYGRASISFSTSSFTTTWTNTDGTQRYIPYWTVSEAQAQGTLYYGTIDNETSISISEALVRRQTLIKTISDTPTITVSESLARIQSRIFTINETAVTIPTETLVGIKKFNKTISDTPTISVSELLTQYSLRLKTISDTPAITISEELARIQTRKFTLSESQITTSELLTATSTQQYNRPISDPTISVSETLARIQSIIKLISETSIDSSEQLGKSLAYIKPISETFITISEIITRVQTLIKLISETSVSESESLSRVQSLIKTISDTPAITSSETLASGLSFTKTISDTPTITVNQTLARVYGANRPITDTPSITAIDSLAKIISLHVALTESQINISESIAGRLSFLKTISESNISVGGGTITRILTAIRAITVATEPSITISDLISRIQTLLKTIAEDAISVNDSPLQAGLFLQISLVESRIKWYYSLLTRKIPES